MASVNKILALIGTIYMTVSSTIFAFFALIFSLSGTAFVNGFQSGYYNSGTVSWEDAYTTGQTVLAIFIFLLIFALLFSITVTVFAWIGWAKLDSEKERGWKVFFLIIGILMVVTLTGLIPGILFILVYALNPKKKIEKKEADERE